MERGITTIKQTPEHAGLALGAAAGEQAGVQAKVQSRG